MERRVHQWVHARVRLAEGTLVTDELVRSVIEQELAAIRAAYRLID